MKKLIEQNLALTLIVSVFIGIFIPYLENIPSISVTVLVSVIVFFSCSKIIFQNIKSISVPQVIFFYSLRYVLVPYFAYTVANLFLDTEYAITILLICLMPSGVTSAALANIMKGEASLAFVITIFTGLITPISVPFMLDLIAGKQIEIDFWNMFQMLSLTIFIPVFLYFAIVKKLNTVNQWVSDNAQFYTIFLIGCVVAVLIASQKHFFYDDLTTVIFAIFLGLILYFVLYIIGWNFAFTKPLKYKITYAISSGTNNLALATAIAFMYFSPLIILFTAIAEISWVIALSCFKKFVDYKQK